MLIQTAIQGEGTERLPPQVQVDVEDLISQRFKVRGVTLPGGLPARSVLAGGHRSRIRGRGMDYVESRHYQAGDDIRTMDWRVTARAGHPHVKVYQEERERPVVILVDFSPSMFFGTRGSFKSVAAARTAALVGWASVAGGDRVGALLANGAHRELVPRGGRRGVMTLLRALSEYGALPDTVELTASGLATSGLLDALARLQRVVRPGSLIYLISDFFGIDGSDGSCARQLSLLRRHNQVVACQVVDPLELAAPPAGRYGVGDGRKGRMGGILDTRSRAGRAAYQDYLSGHHEQVRALLSGRLIQHVVLTTDADIATQLDAAARGGQNDQGGQGHSREAPA